MDVLKNGFVVPKESEGFFYGRGLYLKKTKAGAKMYGDTVVETTLSVVPQKVDKMEAIGTFDQWSEVERESLLKRKKRTLMSINCGKNIAILLRMKGKDG